MPSTRTYSISLDMPGGTLKNAGRLQTEIAAPGNGVSTKLVGLAAGPHSIVGQWRIGSGTGQIRPQTTDDENASLLVQEVSA